MLAPHLQVLGPWEQQRRQEQRQEQQQQQRRQEQQQEQQQVLRLLAEREAGVQGRAAAECRVMPGYRPEGRRTGRKKEACRAAGSGAALGKVWDGRRMVMEATGRGGMGEGGDEGEGEEEEEWGARELTGTLMLSGDACE